jgi:UDP-N-acetylglucosamine--N-acetylmuramyl-(pentapeptide) pyrophosphoryl-undecaprenol N-acetylglucosamine transferase
MKILFTGGGTGGHIFPIIAISREIKRIYPEEAGLQLFYIGPKDEFGSLLFSQEGIKVKTILGGKIRRYLTPQSLFLNFIDIFFKIPISMIQAFFLIFFLAPDLIFSKGGYGSFPVVILGWILDVPIFIHESDISPGFTNKFLSRFALEIFVSFPRTEYFPPKKMILVGNPIRREILEGSKEEAKRIFNLTQEKPVILILGGSQGAQRINDVILEILPEILRDFELIHQSGEKNFEEVEAEARTVLPKELKKYYHIFPFLKEIEIKHAYKICDLIVSRAGSGTIFEISALGKPSILIPLPEAAQDHQLNNAYCFARTGAATVIEEANFTPHFFLEKVKYLLSQPEQLKEMGERAQQFSRPRAAKIISEYIVDYLTFKLL